MHATIGLDADFGQVLKLPDVRRLYDPHFCVDLHALLSEELVVILRCDDTVATKDFYALAWSLGEVDKFPNRGPVRFPIYREYPGLFDIERHSADFGPVVGEDWHRDVSFRAKPHRYGLMNALVLPSSGGETFFSNQLNAYDSLGHDFKRSINELEGVFSSDLFTSKMKSLPKRFSNKSTYENVAVHKLVQRRPLTLQPFLFVDRLFLKSIVGLEPDESLNLINTLCDISECCEFVVQHMWESGDVCVWDNLATLHRANNNYIGQKRVMQRLGVLDREGLAY